jgi:GNAT superfamily N-acetyltransferase
VIESAARKKTSGDESETRRLSLNDRLGLISLIDDGARKGSDDAPVVADLFSNLWDLVAKTAKGAKVDRLKADDGQNGFKVLEIVASSGETLGRLNMLYMRKPLPCYYLVYVEVSSPYRRQGLGHLVIEYFGRFLDEKNAVGLLDNIIPQNDPTYGIYSKNGWLPLEEATGRHVEDLSDYMVFMPSSFRSRDQNTADFDLSQSVFKLVHHLKRRRAAIDMRDNEAMVRQTIAEFKDLHQALLVYFEKEIRSGRHTPLMRFMFTRFVTKLLGFRRRIAELLGYTGGESLGQLSLGAELTDIPMQSYAPREIAGRSKLCFGQDLLVAALPEAFQEDFRGAIENLSNYRRPNLKTWLDAHGRTASDVMTLGDLMDLGFDPTRLKEISINGEEYIFERIQARQLDELIEKKTLLEQASSDLANIKVRKAFLKANPPVLAVRNRGNAYVLRRKVHGIHYEEALEQLQGNPALKGLNQAMRFDGMVKGTVGSAYKKAAEVLSRDEEELRELLTVFVSWDLDSNRPKVMVDAAGSFFESIWLS